jgi:hypothetical protein
MILAPSLKHIWDKHKIELLALHRQENRKPVTHAMLEECYTDKNGARYYRYPKAMAISVDRLGWLTFYYQCLGKALSPEEDSAIDDAISNAIEDGVRDPKKKVMVRIAALIDERNRRKQMCFHTELFYNILCVQWIREDEHPLTFDETIHREKVDQMKMEEDNYFFFRQPELIELASSLRITEQNVKALLAESNQQREILIKKLSLIRSYHST